LRERVGGGGSGGGGDGSGDGGGGGSGSSGSPSADYPPSARHVDVSRYVYCLTNNSERTFPAVREMFLFALLNNEERRR